MATFLTIVVVMALLAGFAAFCFRFPVLGMILSIFCLLE